MPVLKLASCMAENCEPFCQNIAAYIQSRLGIKTAYVNDIPWQERERLFDEGQIQILWLCGLPYVHKADLRENDMELLAVPVPAGSQYCGQPVYFSDVIVREESPFRSFEELRGAVWAYNEPGRTLATTSFELIYPDWVKLEASLARSLSRVPMRSL
jgi:ABC-type phosphate/phosphonate transport system substrate-binding protein